MAARQKLTGFVNMITALRSIIVAKKMAGDSDNRVEFDCSEVDYFSGHALTELAVAKRQLRAKGADLTLSNCSPQIREEMRMPVFQALIA